MATEGLNYTEIAALVGRSEQAVRDADRKGRLASARVSEGRFDPEIAKAIFARTKSNKAGRKPKPRSNGEAVGGTDLFTLQAKHERVKIRERLFKVRRQEERSVDRGAVERLLRGRTQRLQEALMALPMDVAPLVASLTGGELRPILDLLEREFRRFLERMVNEFSSEVRPAGRGRAA